MKPVVFIHTSQQQEIAALVAAYSLKARSKCPDAFDVRLLYLEETPHLTCRDGRRYLYAGQVFTWHNRDLQSFSPLRKMVPQVMGHQGRVLVLDPDVFAVGDVSELLLRDMQGKAILCRTRDGWHQGRPTRIYSSAAMLLDCARLTHWRWNDEIDALFAMRLDFWDWMYLRAEPEESIGLFEDEWNDLDTLTERTKLLHTTERLTQPWRTGLPITYDLNARDAYSPGDGRVRRLAHRFKRYFVPSRQSEPRVHQPHPDPRQERYFFTLLRECRDQGIVTRAFLADQIHKQYVRADVFEMLERAGSQTMSPEAEWPQRRSCS